MTAPGRAPFCADLSRENGEPLAATASRIDNWFLIEYRGLWARDALAGSGLTDQVKEHLREQVALGFARPAPVRQAPGSERPAGAPRFHGHVETGGDDGHEDRARGVRRPARARPPGRKARGPPALPRLHARQARPVLRALRAAALRGAQGRARARPGLAGVAHRRRPVRRQPRLPSRRPLLRPGRPRDGRVGPRRAPRSAHPHGELPRAVDLRVRGPGSRARGPRADGSRRDRRPRPGTSGAGERVDPRRLRRRRPRHTRCASTARPAT